jgi:hypothetical protein
MGNVQFKTVLVTLVAATLSIVSAAPIPMIVMAKAARSAALRRNVVGSRAVHSNRLGSLKRIFTEQIGPAAGSKRFSSV